VWGLKFGVWDLGIGFWGVGCRIWSPEFGVRTVWEFEVQGIGFEAQG
jgi:hypothetical protein